MKCTVCESINTDNIGITPATDFYDRCNDCGSIFLNDLTKVNKDMYNSDYVSNLDGNVEYRKRYAGVFFYYKELFYHLLKKKTGRYLEIGFSNPGILYGLKKAGWDVTGIDIANYSQKSLDEFKSRGVNYIQGDVVNTKLKGSFDFIWASHLVEHLDSVEIRLLLSNMKDLLTDDGVIYLSSPSADLYGTDLSISFLLASCKPEEHVILYTADTFAKLASEAGLTRRLSEAYTDPVPGKFQYQTKLEWRQIFTKGINE